MRLSIIIVNYNVRYFIEQCLYSVLKAVEGIEAEIFVVDNNSVDGSVEMINERFPEIKLIVNKGNLGFAKANNLAIRQSSGEYVLLLNPDTLVEQDTFTKALGFLDQHPEAGGLGVKMIDGKGKFLPESKRGLPTPLVAFYKISGLSGLFPKSRTFGRYHLGFLDKDSVNEVDILSGACMFIRKSTLEQTGLLDESFFMYGEDIDLSYRIQKSGYKNYYFPEARIIHYKGESTKKSSINYVFMFYRAMIVFARKHFSSKKANTFSALVHFAIYLRASLAILSRLFARLLLPLLDAILIWAGMLAITKIWEKVIFPWGGEYPDEFYYFALPVYLSIWIFTVFLSGGYDRPLSIGKLLQGLSLGTLIILVLYSLLPESYRFSRALILFGYIWSLLACFGLRLFMDYVLHLRHYRLGSGIYRRILIVGGKQEAGRVAAMVRNNLMNPGFIGLVSLNGNAPKEDGFIGHLDQIDEIIEIYRIDEIIFCASDIQTRLIMDKMSELQSFQVDYKIAPPESLSIIGSKSISTPGDLYIVDIDSIGRIDNRRKKFFFDSIISLLLLCLLPVMAFIVKSWAGLTANIFYVLFGKRSWVGYYAGTDIGLQKLPRIRKSILNPCDVFPNKKLDAETIEKLNLLYARDYKVSNDLYILWKGYRKLGRKT